MLIIVTLFACTLVAMLMNFMSTHYACPNHRDPMTTTNKKEHFGLLYVYGYFVNQGTIPLLIGTNVTAIMSYKALRHKY